MKALKDIEVSVKGVVSFEASALCKCKLCVHVSYRALYSVLAVNLSFLFVAGEYRSHVCVYVCVFCFVVRPFGVTSVLCI